MALKVFGESSNIANLVIAKDTATFASMGFNGTNISQIFEVGANGLRSWVPGRSLNPITGTTQGRGYYIVAKEDLDISDYFEVDGGGAGVSIISKTELNPSANTSYQLAPDVMAWKFFFLTPTGDTIRIGRVADTEDIMGDTPIPANAPFFYTSDVEPGVEMFFNGITGPITIVIYKLEI